MQHRPVPLDTIGGFVYTELHGTCSWIGHAKSVYAKFDVDPASLRLLQLYKHVVEVYEREGDDSDMPGFIKAIVLTKPAT